MNIPSLILYAGIAVSFMACNDTDKPNSDRTSPVDASVIKTQDSNSVSNTAEDSIALTTLVRNMYEWHERAFKEAQDFDVMKLSPADTVYKSIDWTKHNNILSKLKQADFFTTEFLENYQNIAKQIDTALKTGAAVWPEGELPAIGALEANPWLNAQDIPAERYWETLTLTNIQFVKNEAAFKWTLGNDYNYTMKARKVDGRWKISYMQGFEPGNYSPSH